MDTFERTAVQRRRIADQLDGLTEEQWQTPSLCGLWTVRDVAAHLVVPLSVSMAGAGLEMVKALGRFDVANDRMARQLAARHGADLPRVLRDLSDRRFVPPGGTPSFQLADVMIHGQDIRRPLGLDHGFTEEDSREVLDLLTSPVSARGFVPARRREGLRFVTTDLTGPGGEVWSAGEGAVVEGPAEALMLALTGRPVALADLRGDGVAVLSSRMPAA